MMTTTEDHASWIIATPAIEPTNYYSVTVANGMIGITSSPEMFKVKDMLLAGVYDLCGRGRVSNFLRGFNLLNMSLEINGCLLGAHNLVNHRQILDMKHASFTARADYGDLASLSYTYYALRHLPYSVLMEVTVTPKMDLTIEATSALEGPESLRDVQCYYSMLDQPHVRIGLNTSTARSPAGKHLLCASSAFVFPEPRGSEPGIVHQLQDTHMHSMKFSKELKAGECYRFALVGTSITTAHHDDPLNEAERLTIYAVMQGRDKLVKMHDQAWDRLWESDIAIEPAGPEVADEVAQTQQSVRSMLYHLYSFTREGTSSSPSPMGLSGLGYNGHIFWDSELWMFPPMLQLHPEVARSMLTYRFDRLEAAKRNAFSKGFRGAMFPWESAESGVEETPVHALTGPFEHHITADVALAAWQYYCVTQDKTWLRETGWPILKNTADFWASRVERNGPGHFDINNVVAADEWAENVDNNAFTNAAAKANLKCAAEAATALGVAADPDWLNVADNIPILSMDGNVTREHATYQGESVKQADVNLLSYPLKEITAPDQIRRDLEYYSSRVPHDGTPAMTQAIFALLYARLGDRQKAYHFFKESYLPNQLPPFGVFAETKDGNNPYFATGAGGVLQAVLNGFGGLEITSSGITRTKSVLPSNWKSLTMTGIGPERMTFIANQ